MDVKTYETEEEVLLHIDKNSKGYNGIVYELKCDECGNVFYSVGFSKYQKAVCSCGEDTNGMVNTLRKGGK